MQETEWIQQQKVNFKNILLKSKQNTEQVSLAIFVALPIICSLCASADVCFLLFSFVSPRSLACMCVRVCGVVNSTWSQTVSGRETQIHAVIFQCVFWQLGPRRQVISIQFQFDLIQFTLKTQRKIVEKFKCYVHISYAAAVVSRWELKQQQKQPRDIHNNSNNNCNIGDNKNRRTLWRVRKLKMINCWNNAEYKNNKIKRNLLNFE